MAWYHSGMTPERMTNQQLADIFTRIGDMLEIKGEVIYKILAYRKAADSLSNLGRDVNDDWREGKLTEIPGVGKAIAEKIDELLSTGKLEFLEKLKQEVPESLVEELQVPDLGPKKVALFWKELGVTNLAELEAAGRAGRLRSLPGMGEKSEAKVLAGIEALSRRSDRIPLGRAWPFAVELLAFLRGLPGVAAAEAAGSLRRMRPTVGDIDLLVAASDSAEIMTAFTAGKTWHVCVARERPSPVWSSITGCAPSCGCTRQSDLALLCSTQPARKTTMCACASWR